jgi:ferritin-like metal-binding protein YciE
MAKAASNEALRTAFQDHLEETKEHVNRLDEAFRLLEKSPRAEHCKAMEGLIEEGADLIEEEGEAQVKDAALIGAAQRVEHYEIAAYGTARTIAQMIGNDEVAKLLEETLEEEKAADEKLTDIAMNEVNTEAEEVSE